MKSRSDVPLRRWERLSNMRGFGTGRNQRDPRGWTVVDRDRRSVGEVKDLIVDTDRMMATHLDVELDAKRFDLRDNDPHVLVPIEHARPDGKRVIVEPISPRWFEELCSARTAHEHEFWDRWWGRGAEDESRGPLIARVDRDELQRAIDEVRPGETVRIPVAEEEIVVERRPLTREPRRETARLEDVRHEDARREEYVMNRAGDEPPASER